MASRDDDEKEEGGGGAEPTSTPMFIHSSWTPSCHHRVRNPAIVLTIVVPVDDEASAAQTAGKPDNGERRNTGWVLYDDGFWSRYAKQERA